MLNTASVGLYPNLVRRREQLQPALGKPVAGVVAMFRTFAAGTPTTLIVNGVRHRLWILYIGRGRYYPRDHAPLVRPVLADGVLDLRMITADEPFARLRLLWAVLTGTVATSGITHLTETDRITRGIRGQAPGPRRRWRGHARRPARRLHGPPRRTHLLLAARLSPYRSAPHLRDVILADYPDSPLNHP